MSLVRKLCVFRKYIIGKTKQGIKIPPPFIDPKANAKLPSITNLIKGQYNSPF